MNIGSRMKPACLSALFTFLLIIVQPETHATDITYPDKTVNSPILHTDFNMIKVAVNSKMDNDAPAALFRGVYSVSQVTTMGLPVGPDNDDLIVIRDCDSYCDQATGGGDGTYASWFRYETGSWVCIGGAGGTELVQGVDYLTPAVIASSYQTILATPTEEQAEDLDSTTPYKFTPERAGQNSHQVMEDHYGWRSSKSAVPAAADQWFGMLVYFVGYTAGGSSGDPASEHAAGWDGPYIGYCASVGTPGTWVSWLRLTASGLVIPNAMIGAPDPEISDPDTWTLTGYGFRVANAPGSASHPAAASGMNSVTSVRGAHVVVIDPNGTEEIFLNEVSCGAGVSIQSEGNGGERVAIQYGGPGDLNAAADGWICTP